MHCINLRTLRWSQVSLRSHSPSGSRAAPVRTGHCATVHAGKLLLFGGLRDDGRFLDGVTVDELPRPVEIVATDGIALRQALETAS